ncbi:MAG: GNAT family N-acetyltransferase, partial [Verrucomicrobia bacterium]|nr:GNAT family N-acetyltransferase [Verrucomicrobiota bacterium]
MSSASACIVVEADLNRPDHQQAVVALTDAYAQDPMGNCEALPKTVCEELIPALRRHPTTVIFLAYAGSKAIGIATCFYGFSTFAARPLLNIHDLAVLPEHRAQGVGKALLQAVEAKARAQG